MKKYNFNLSGRYTSDKLLPKKDFKETGNPYNPTEDLTLSTDSYFVLNFSFLAEDLLVKGFDLMFKVDNFTNQRYYDAGREVLYPQTGIRFWGGASYKF
jgi:outer membrane receptor protein involved in Fe transport